MEEKESSWVRERELMKEAELGTTSAESSSAKMVRLLWLKEEGHEGERNLLSLFLTRPRWPSQMLFMFLFFIL